VTRVISQIIVHCAYTPPSMDIGAKEIRAWHVDGNGWLDIGYHYVIRRGGQVEPGRDLDGDGDVIEEVGAHARGFNANSIGICLVGGKAEGADRPDCNFTTAQWDALDKLVRTLTQRFSGVAVIGHRDVDPNKDCPTFDVKAWWHPYGG
jgi:N-acetylmuramoyl-L-alanine amidase